VSNTPATRYPIASLTKQFTAVLTMRMVERGRIDLDQPVSRYLPWYRKDAGDRITVRDLLSHTAGLPEIPQELASEAGAADRGARGLVERHDPGPLTFDPGTAFAYTNTGYQLLGAILEELEGEAFESILRAEILEPLGMTSTGIARRDAELPGRAVDYSPREDDGVVTWVRTPVYHWENWHAAGAMYSTVEDLHLWNAALTGGRLLRDEMYELMLTPRTDVGSDGNYVALGSWVYPRALPGSDEQPVIVERRGAIGGYAALNAFARDGDWWVVALANSYNEQIHQLPWGSSMPLDLILVLYGLEPEGPPEG
ncbi:MAG: beta-lactamase family protein, partial [Gemmatimonadetes bacterium]|nr:beta-lactamase family protein [Gemmatimonadota bacterium]